MKKVVVAGFYGDFTNYGDYFLMDSVNWIITSVPNVSIEKLSFTSKNIKLFNKLFAKILFIISKFFPKFIKYRLEFLANKIKYKRLYKNTIKNCNYLIFSGGSLKYSTQHVWAYYSLIVDICSKYNIPVMFNAMNIQKNDLKDWRCKRLIKCCNNNSVKIITSRDGISGKERLLKDYIKNNRIIVDGVGDTAFWLDEVYSISRDSNSNKIGVNIIRPDIFLNYGYNISVNDVINYYIDLIELLINNKYNFEIFTNGLKADEKILVELVNKYGNLLTIKIPNSAENLVNIISNYSFVVGARLHACICAYTLDIPVCGFIWDEKIYSFSKIANIKNKFIDYKSFNAKNMFNLIDNYKYNQELKEMWKNKTKYYILRFINEF